eukprot:615241-Pleurochrysis_carterae.AAC.1
MRAHDAPLMHAAQGVIGDGGGTLQDERYVSTPKLRLAAARLCLSLHGSTDVTWAQIVRLYPHDSFQPSRTCASVWLSRQQASPQGWIRIVRSHAASPQLAFVNSSSLPPMNSASPTLHPQHSLGRLPLLATSPP